MFQRTRPVFTSVATLLDRSTSAGIARHPGLTRELTHAGASLAKVKAYLDHYKTSDECLAPVRAGQAAAAQALDAVNAAQDRLLELDDISRFYDRNKTSVQRRGFKSKDEAKVAWRTCRRHSSRTLQMRHARRPRVGVRYVGISQPAHAVQQPFATGS